MRRFYKITLGIAAAMVLASCQKYEALDFHVDKPASFAKQEAIDVYNPLKTYVNRNASPKFKLGAGVSLGPYV